MFPKNPAYYVFFHGLVWLIYGAGYYADVVRWEKPADYWQVVLLVTLSANLIAFGLSLPYLASRRYSLALKCAVIVLGALVAAGLWSWCKYLVLFYFYAPDTRPLSAWRFLGLNFYSGVHIFVFWSVLFFFYEHYRQAQENKLAALTAQSLARENQLKLLSYQLNPHFLFNALNSIATLVLRKDTEAAHKTVVGLSSFLRSTLEAEPWRKVPLAKEIECLRQYLEIQKIRFADRLSFDLDVAGTLLDAYVPALILQPLAENAVKHALAGSNDEVRIALTAREDGGALVLCLSNTRSGAPTGTGGNGLGLANVTQRLQAYYGSAATLDLADGDASFDVTLRLPMEGAAT